MSRSLPHDTLNDIRVRGHIARVLDTHWAVVLHTVDNFQYTLREVPLLYMPFRKATFLVSNSLLSRGTFTLGRFDGHIPIFEQFILARCIYCVPVR